MHCGVEVTESSTNKQHHLSLWYKWALREVERCIFGAAPGKPERKRSIMIPQRT
jgi:hypothetical protein